MRRLCSALLAVWAAAVGVWLHAQLRELPTLAPAAPDAFGGAALAHVYYALESGVTLHALRANGSAASAREPLLFVHGFPDYSEMWLAQLRYFSVEHGRDCVALDMRGYYASSRPAGVWNYATSTLVGDLREVIERFLGGRVVLVAHDWGGALAWMLAAQHPELVSKFVPLNIPHPIVFRNTLLSSWTQAKMSWYILFFQLPLLPELLMSSESSRAKIFAHLGPERTARLAHLASPMSWTPMINYYRAALFASGTELAKVRVPTLIIWGIRDVALSTPMAVESADWVEPRAELRLLDASHWVASEAPDRVNALIAEFLDSGSASSE